MPDRPGPGAVVAEAFERVIAREPQAGVRVLLRGVGQLVLLELGLGLRGPGLGQVPGAEGRQGPLGGETEAVD